VEEARLIMELYKTHQKDWETDEELFVNAIRTFHRQKVSVKQNDGDICFENVSSIFEDFDEYKIIRDRQVEKQQQIIDSYQLKNFDGANAKALLKKVTKKLDVITNYRDVPIVTYSVAFNNFTAMVSLNNGKIRPRTSGPEAAF